MRITEGSRYRITETALNELRSSQATVMEQITTGRRVGDPSDDPVAAAELTRLSARLSRTRDYQRSITQVRSDLSLSERTLDSSSALLSRAHELAVQGANGSLSQSDRKSLAEDVRGIREQLLSLANTRGTRGYLFAGSQTNGAAFAADGSYQGDQAKHRVEIAPGVELDVTVTGSEAFGVGSAEDAFAVLSELEASLLADDTTRIAANLGGIESARSQVVRVQGQTGLLLNRLDSADEILGRTELELSERSSALGEVDPFRALSELSSLSSALDQAIAVARQTLNSGRGWF